MELSEFIKKHAERGACRCGKCFDAPANPESKQPSGHTADLVFFEVCARDNPSAMDFVMASKAHRGEFGDPLLNPFDGKEHGYIELGGWLGDQGAALMYMGLGVVLGVFDLLTPKTMLPGRVPESLAMQMAQHGYVTVRVKPEYKS
jgi:hypothetical protein